MPWLERLGLHRTELRAWAMYEWAVTAMWAVVVTSIFPIYYQNVLAADLEGPEATRNFAIATTLGIVLVAVAAPLLGAVTDRTATKKPLLAAFAGVGIAATGLLFFVQEGEWQLGLLFFVFVNIGVNGSMVFYDALLPHVARAHEVDRVSAGAFAIGYLGAGLLLAFSLLLVQMPDLFGLEPGTLPVRVVFLLVAGWWALFSIPLLVWVAEPRPVLDPGEAGGMAAAGAQQQGNLGFAINRIRSTFRELRTYRNAFLVLIAFLIYGDGIGTIIRMATVYGAELGIGQAHMIAAVVMVQFVGVPFSFLFGNLAGRIGTRPAIFLGLVIYSGISLLGFFMTTEMHFWALAFLVGTVQGGTQALSRSLYSSMIPAYKSGELFGFYGVIDKFAGMFGPTIMALVIQLTGSSRHAVLSVMLFFIIGGLVLAMVDVEGGRHVAREAQLRASTGARNGPGGQGQGRAKPV